MKPDESLAVFFVTLALLVVIIIVAGFLLWGYAAFEAAGG